jgi:hypothetical protein
MRSTSVAITGLFAVAMAVSFSSTSGCGGGGSGSHFGGGDDGGGSSGSGGSSSSSGLFGDDGSGSGGSSSGGTNVQCPAGTQCNVSCTGTATTSISGKVYDPALKNGLYNVVVYVPGGPLQALPSGVPTGTDACNCGALFKSGAVVSTTTGVDGTFKLNNAPVGASVPLVLQVGKWRRAITVNTSMNSCGNTQEADKTLSLPGTLAGAGPNDNMPDIAVSTGSADTLECAPAGPTPRTRSAPRPRVTSTSSPEGAQAAAREGAAAAALARPRRQAWPVRPRAIRTCGTCRPDRPFRLT